MSTPSSSTSEPFSDTTIMPWRTAFYIALTSTVYTVVAVAVIILLLFILIGLIFFYFTRIRNKKYEYSTETVKYSQVNQLDDNKSTKKKRSKKKPPPSKKPSSGRGYEAAPVYNTSATQLSSMSVSPHMDISAGYLVLNYIESNLKDEHQLQAEWENLCQYVPEASSTSVAERIENRAKNRPNSFPYDHSRVKLDEDSSVDGSDYINASYIIDTDPRHPKYIATQAPLKKTTADFWQMVWEREVSVIVMLCTQEELDAGEVCQYWPASGLATYHTFEVRLVSEHVHSDDYTFRSFILQNTRTYESRTVTHSLFLSWESLEVPDEPASLLEFRRKVNKAHGSKNVPLLVHCSDGVGRTGTYILIDMELERVQSGAKELNLGATVEHLRDHRPGMVRNKAQFEFAVSALVDEIRVTLEAASQKQKSA